MERVTLPVGMVVEGESEATVMVMVSLVLTAGVALLVAMIALSYASQLLTLTAFYA